MKTEITIAELGAMSDDEFIAHIIKYPWPRDWSSRRMFNAANNRLGNMQGLRPVRKPATPFLRNYNLIPAVEEIQASMNC